MTQPKINLNHLKSCSQEELISDIAELFKKIPAVKDYYLLKLYPQEGKEIRLSTKRLVKTSFFPVVDLVKVDFM